MRISHNKFSRISDMYKYYTWMCLHQNCEWRNNGEKTRRWNFPVLFTSFPDRCQFFFWKKLVFRIRQPWNENTIQHFAIFTLSLWNIYTLYLSTSIVFSFYLAYILSTFVCRIFWKRIVNPTWFLLSFPTDLSTFHIFSSVTPFDESSSTTYHNLICTIIRFDSFETNRSETNFRISFLHVRYALI